MTKLTSAQVRRNIAIRNKMKAKAAAMPATEPKQPFKPSFTVETFSLSGRTIETGVTQGDNAAPFVTMKAEGARTVMAFGQIVAGLQASNGDLDVVIKYGRGAAKIVALVANDGSMTDENGEAFDLAAAQAA